MKRYDDLSHAEGREWVEPIKQSITSVDSPVPVGPLYTAADLKAARLETVERCLYLLDLYISNVGPLAAKKAIEMFKEEIENE